MPTWCNIPQDNIFVYEWLFTYETINFYVYLISTHTKATHKFILQLYDMYTTIKSFWYKMGSEIKVQKSRSQSTEAECVKTNTLYFKNERLHSRFCQHIHTYSMIPISAGSTSWIVSTTINTCNGFNDDNIIKSFAFPGYRTEKSHRNLYLWSRLSLTCGILCSAKICHTTGLSRLTHCHGKSAAFWMTTFQTFYNKMRHEDFSTLLNMSVNNLTLWRKHIMNNIVIIKENNQHRFGFDGLRFPKMSWTGRQFSMQNS